MAEYPIGANSETLFPCYVGVALGGTRPGGDAIGTLRGAGPGQRPWPFVMGAIPRTLRGTVASLNAQSLF